MKIRHFSLLLAGGAIVAAAALFTNCAKDNLHPTPTAVPETPAAERAVCVVKIKTTGPIQVCGTQTNATACSICPACVGVIGVENLTAGFYGYTLNAATMIRITNTGTANVDVLIATVNGNEIFQLTPGASRAYYLSDTCDLTLI